MLRNLDKKKDHRIFWTWQTPIYLIVIFTIFATSLSSKINTNDEYIPVSVVVFTRHGARAPLKPCFNQSWVYEVGKANLTANGQRQHYELGSKLRKVYFGGSEDPSKINITIISSYASRTLNSAMSQVQGLVNFEGASLGLNISLPHSSRNPEYSYLPNFVNFDKRMDLPVDLKHSLPFGQKLIPIKTLPLLKDDLFIRGKGISCPKGFQLKKEQLSGFIKHNNYLGKDIFQKMNDQGLKIQNFYPKENQWNLYWIKKFYVNLLTHSNYFGRPYLQSKIDKDLRIKLKCFLLFYQTSRKFSSIEMEKMYTTGISKLVMNQFLERDKQPVDDKSGPKFEQYTLLSGYDENVLSFLMRYNLTSQQCALEEFQKNEDIKNCTGLPLYASHLEWELSKKKTITQVNGKTEYLSYVRILLDGEAIQIGGRDQYMSLLDFNKIVEDSMTLSSQEIYQLCFGDSKISHQWLYLGLLIIIIMFLIAMLCLMVVVSYQIKGLNTKIKNIKNKGYRGVVFQMS